MMMMMRAVNNISIDDSSTAAASASSAYIHTGASYTHTSEPPDERAPGRSVNNFFQLNV
jgi:hypothetical protein